ncbi:MAG: hypothetical protein GXP22_01470 [Gammaproteobacteria bacterium]|nr:hypothetical protein [Gammaproteobacteria bacterium]
MTDYDYERINKISLNSVTDDDFRSIVTVTSGNTSHKVNVLVFPESFEDDIRELNAAVDAEV